MDNLHLGSRKNDVNRTNNQKTTEMYPKAPSRPRALLAEN